MFKRGDKAYEKEATYVDVRRAAMNALARREHAYQELHTKLSKRFSNTDLVDQALDALREENLQSDERYTEAFIRYRKMKGQGPVRIANELRQSGVAAYLVEQHLDSADEEWKELAKEIRERRFGDAPITDNKVRAKQQRFLQYRGFSSSQIRAAIESI